MTISPEAIEAAARALYAIYWPGCDFDKAEPDAQANARRDALAALTAGAEYIAEQARVTTLKEAARDLDPVVPDTNYLDAPLVGLTVASCMEWLEARAATPAGGTS